MKYGFVGCLRLLKSIIYTKLFFPKTRLIRIPFDLRNRRNIITGKGLTTEVGCPIEPYPKLESLSTFI